MHVSDMLVVNSNNHNYVPYIVSANWRIGDGILSMSSYEADVMVR